MKTSYPCQCHICGKRYDLRSSFVSFGYAGSVVGEDGIARGYRSCGEHSREEVRAAFLRITGLTESFYGEA